MEATLIGPRACRLTRTAGLAGPPPI